MSEYKCEVCKQYFSASETYEYRGAYACAEHFDEAIERRDIVKIDDGERAREFFEKRLTDYRALIDELERLY